MYSHIVELPEGLQEKTRNRIIDLNATLNRQDEDVQALFNAFQKELLSDEDTEEEFIDVLFPYVDSEKILEMKDMMAGPVGRFVRYVLSEDYYKLFEKYLQIEKGCAVSCCSETVPVGGKRPLLHINVIDWAIKDFFALDASGLDDEEILMSCCTIEESEDGEYWQIQDIAYITTEWLTVKLVSRDQTIIDFVSDELDKKDYSDLSCQIFITPILKSANFQLLNSIIAVFIHQEEYAELFVGQVLSLHVGINPKSMMLLIDSMNEDEKLKEIMGPSLFEMLFPKEDMGIEEDPDGELLKMAADCLFNSKLRNQMLSDNNPHKVYVALWATGFYDADEAWNVANELIKDGRPLSKEVVLTYYKNHWAKKSLEVITQRIGNLS
ncbi:MAG: hypothetical protein ILA29_04840 [Prevotella sp.]|nr:hypothetical protein [Prevotella sp.]